MKLGNVWHSVPKTKDLRSQQKKPGLGTENFIYLLYLYAAQSGEAVGAKQSYKTSIKRKRKKERQEYITISQKIKT